MSTCGFFTDFQAIYVHVNWLTLRILTCLGIMYAVCSTCFQVNFVHNSITKLHIGICVCENIILGVDGE